MTLPLAFHPAVQGEIDDAYCWYERQRAGLSDDFLQSLDEAFLRLSTPPMSMA